MMTEAHLLRQAADRVERSGVLREGKLRRLFDYLLASTLAAKSPKEIAIAMDVFGKDATYDVSQDALVRVYIHKLRKILDAYSTDPVNQGSPGLYIPKGEYRLAVRPAAGEESDAVAAQVLAGAQPRPAFSPRLPWMLAGALGAALAVALVMISWPHLHPTALDKVRADRVWSAVLKDDRPLMIVVGDYYLIGESDSSMEIRRLVREYSVNSAADLNTYIQVHPETADKYTDVGLRYIPTSTAYALADVMPILDNGARPVALAQMSDVTPTMLKTYNLVYIGYLSGLGVLQDLVFSASNFAIGSSYDELRDKSKKHVYISQSASENMGDAKRFGSDASYRDYGFFSTFKGPGGNTIIVIAGTRDEGVRQTAEAYTNPGKLRAFSPPPGGSASFDALLEVRAIDGVNLTGTLLAESNREKPR